MSVLFVLTVCFSTGCQTTDRSTSEPLGVISDIMRTNGALPALIYIPNYFGGGYTGKIALPNDKHKTTGPIRVVVRGEVVVPGLLQISSGCTVLQAIAAVGGFTRYPYIERFTITRSSGSKVVVYFHSRPQLGGNLIQVWCDTKEDVERVMGSSGDALQDKVVDYVLEDGDAILVGRAVF
jgi:hypothetical protein